MQTKFRFSVGNGICLAFFFIAIKTKPKRSTTLNCCSVCLFWLRIYLFDFFFFVFFLSKKTRKHFTRLVTQTKTHTNTLNSLRGTHVSKHRCVFCYLFVWFLSFLFIWSLFDSIAEVLENDDDNKQMQGAS